MYELCGHQRLMPRLLRHCEQAHWLAGYYLELEGTKNCGLLASKSDFCKC